MQIRRNGIETRKIAKPVFNDAFKQNFLLGFFTNGEFCPVRLVFRI